VSNTQWSLNYEYPDSFYAEAFSLDDNTTFSTAEQDIIQSVWQQVSEDFAPFDVDVTTQDPGFDAINRSSSADLAFGTRVVITDRSGIEAQCSCAGISYLDVFDEPKFHSRYQPAFVFPPALGVRQGGHVVEDRLTRKKIAEEVSHQAGHNLGLGHDGTASAKFYEGHGAWAPIMGVGYNRPITQWSRGEYTGANNTEDDLAYISQNGAPLLADDYGNTNPTAKVLGAGPIVAVTGTITTDADVDVFRVDAPAGVAKFTVAPAPNGPNLDVRLELRNGAGTLLAVDDPPSALCCDQLVAAGMGASLSVDLAPGPYYLWVSGVGAAVPATDGYSGYGSLGKYTLQATMGTARTLAISDVTVLEGADVDTVKAAGFVLTLSAASKSTVSVVAKTANGSAVAGSDYTAVSTTVTFPAGTTSRTLAVPIISDSAFYTEYDETFYVNLTSPVGTTISDSQGLATIVDDDGPPNDPFAGARPLLKPSGTFKQSNVYASTEFREPLHQGTGGRSLWYRWTAPATGAVSFDTFGSNFETVMSVYTGTAVNALKRVADGVHNSTGQSKVTFNATAGVTYQIAVDGYFGAKGTVTLNWAQPAV
jgi:hypothetical protein